MTKGSGTEAFASWAYVIYDALTAGHIGERVESTEGVTSARGELLATIEGAKAALWNDPESVTIFSRSDYVVNVWERWAFKWYRAKKLQGKKHPDLLEEILRIKEEHPNVTVKLLVTESRYFRYTEWLIKRERNPNVAPFKFEAQDSPKARLSAEIRYKGPKPLEAKTMLRLV